MDQEKMQAIALMRYSAISPLIAGSPEDYPSRDAFFRDASVKGVTAPDGSLRHYAPGTIEKWYYSYKEGGFNGLLPSGRSDLGKPRKLADALQEQIRYLKTNYPRMSAAAIFRQLKDSGCIRNGEVSESTITRYIKLLALEKRPLAIRICGAMNALTSISLVWRLQCWPLFTAFGWQETQSLHHCPH